jgi:arylsulfatase A-like enzyme
MTTNPLVLAAALLATLAGAYAATPARPNILVVTIDNLPFNAPHSVDADNYGPGEPVRYRVPDKYLALYGSEPDEPNDRIRYFAVISALDDAIGRMLRALDELKLRDHTLVVFFNDNGANTSREHGLKFATNAPFRGGRPDCWEGGIRVPAVFRWPGRLPSDVDCHEPLIATDVLPMILSAVCPVRFDG